MKAAKALVSRAVHGSGHVANEIHGGDRLVSGPRREIHQQKIKSPPIHTSKQLVDEFILVGVSPDNCKVRVINEKAHRGQRDIVRLDGSHPSPRILLKAPLLAPEHFRDVGPVDINVCDPHAVAF